MSLGFGRKPAPAAGKVSSGRYAANVRAAIGRHRPRVGGGSSATVAFSIGPGRWIAGREDRPLERQASARSGGDRHGAGGRALPAAAGGRSTSTFSIQIYFR